MPYIFKAPEDIEGGDEIYRDVSFYKSGESIVLCNNSICYNAGRGISERPPSDSSSIEYSGSNVEKRRVKAILNESEKIGYLLSVNWLVDKIKNIGNKIETAESIVRAVEMNNVDNSTITLIKAATGVNDEDVFNIIDGIKLLHDPVFLSAMISNINDGEQYAKTAYKDIPNEVLNEITQYAMNNLYYSDDKDFMSDIIYLTMLINPNNASQVKTIIEAYGFDQRTNRDVIHNVVWRLGDIGIGKEYVNKLIDMVITNGFVKESERDTMLSGTRYKFP